MAHFELTDSEERGIVADEQDFCDYCHNQFEIEEDVDEDDHPVPVVNVPVECDKGNFCCEAHRAQAMYEAQDEAGKEVLRRYHLGAMLMLEYRKQAEPIMNDWEINYGGADDPEEVAYGLSPEGGIHGEESAEDDCDALLMPKAVRQIIWNALFDGKMAAEVAVLHAEQMNATYLGGQYKAKEIVLAKEKLASIEAAFAALNGCTEVL